MPKEIDGLIDTFFSLNDLQVKFHENGQELYDVDLEELVDSAALLDYIYQIRGKTWCTKQVIGDFIEEVENACEQVFSTGVQGVYCSGGSDHEVDWAKKTSKIKKN